MGKGSDNNKKLSTGKKILITAGTIVSIKAVNELSIKPASMAIKVLFSGIYSGPKNYDEIKRKTIVIKDIDYNSGIDKGLLDINMPLEENNKNKPLVILLHGGGFVGGHKESIAAYSRTLSSNGYVVANIGYALAPEYQYPTPIIQITKAIEYLKENAEKFHIDINNVFVGGGSAGAQIASQIAAIQTNNKLSELMGIQPVLTKSQLKGVLLFGGLYNMETVVETGFPGMRKYLWAYTGEKHFKSYSRLKELSTVKQITKDYPKSFITAGNRDWLLSQSKEFVKELEKNNVYYKAMFFEKSQKILFHEFQFRLQSEVAVKVLNNIVAFINENIVLEG